MSEDYIPFMQYRGAVDPRSIICTFDESFLLLLPAITVEVSSDEDEPPPPVVPQKKPVRGRAKRQRTDSYTQPTETKQKQQNFVVIDDDDEEKQPLKSASPEPMVSLRPTVQDPNLSAAMQLISQNKKLRSELRKSADPQRREEPVDTIPITDESIVFVVQSASSADPPKFRCLKTEPLEKLLQAYCKYRKIPLDSGVLKWYGITLSTQKTAAEYKMEAQLETVDFVQNQMPAGTTTTSSNELVQDSQTSSFTLQPQTVNNDSIVLKVRRGDVTKKFKIKKTDNMQKLRDGYGKKNNVDVAGISLHFDGLPLALTDTPLDHDMEDGDLIDVEVS